MKLVRALEGYESSFTACRKLIPTNGAIVDRRTMVLPWYDDLNRALKKNLNFRMDEEWNREKGIIKKTLRRLALAISGNVAAGLAADSRKRKVFINMETVSNIPLLSSVCGKTMDLWVGRWEWVPQFQDTKIFLYIT
ncbi:hypothetical protein SLA2020_071620 [Shorea laevis]